MASPEMMPLASTPVLDPPWLDPALAWEAREGPLRVRLARGPADVDRVLELRYRVFNLELGEGLERSHATGRDRDEFDAQFRHLLVEEAESGEVVGTYRLQTAEMAAAGRGFYSDAEYDLGGLPAGVLARSVEVGRACIAAPWRGSLAFFLLWKGLASCIGLWRRRYFFGCCSLPTLDAGEAMRVQRWLRAAGHLHPQHRVVARPGYACGSGLDLDLAAPEPEPPLPKLFKTYLRYGARVVSEPALDRDFGVIDFLVVLDIARLPEAIRRRFGAAGTPAPEARS